MLFVFLFPWQVNTRVMERSTRTKQRRKRCMRNEPPILMVPFRCFVSCLLCSISRFVLFILHSHCIVNRTKARSQQLQGFLKIETFMNDSWFRSYFVCFNWIKHAYASLPCLSSIKLNKIIHFILLYRCGTESTVREQPQGWLSSRSLCSFK